MLKDWNIEELTGYHPLTTFYQDFSAADQRGQYAIIDTVKAALKIAKKHYKYLTELAMVMSWKSWEHYDDHNYQLQGLYTRLYDEIDELAIDTLTGQELDYYIKATD